MKRIYVLRHAKSSWDAPSIDDHDRPLAPRGRKAAARVGVYIEESGFEPQLVLCSTARRARQTLEGIRGALGEKVSIEFESDLYHASADGLIDRLRTIDDAISSVMVIGHNPALAELVLALVGEEATPDRVRAKFPTAALATLAFDGEWRALERGEAQLVDYVVPKDLIRER